MQIFKWVRRWLVPFLVVAESFLPQWSHFAFQTPSSSQTRVNSFHTTDVSFLCEPREWVIPAVPSSASWSSTPSSMAITWLPGRASSTGMEAYETCSGWTLLLGVSITNAICSPTTWHKLTTYHQNWTIQKATDNHKNSYWQSQNLSFNLDRTLPITISQNNSFILSTEHCNHLTKSPNHSSSHKIVHSF